MKKMVSCPNCKCSFKGPSIPRGLLATGLYGDLEACKKVAVSYGWTQENKRYFGKNITMIKSMSRDVKSYFRCDKCSCVITQQEYYGS